MTDLSPQLQKLVLAAKGASRPSEAAQTRVLQALEARLGSSAIIDNGSATTVGSTTVPTFVIKAAAVSAVGIALIGGGAWLNWGARTHTPPAEVSGTAAPSSVAAPLESATDSSPAPDIPAELPTIPDLEAKTAAPNGTVRGIGRNRDRLAEEVALISRAQSEIAGARPDNALRVLGEHERKFPNGLLTEERIAARVQALCALGRTTEANAQLKRLSPGSLHHRKQSQAACGAQPKPVVRQ